MDVVRGITEVLSPVIAIITACIVTYIAIQQHITNRQKLRLNLYEKRI